MGTQLTYVAIGVPPPPPADGNWASSAGWGGMEVGENMLYRTQCVDGWVTALGGRPLRDLCRALAPLQKGRAGVTPATAELLKSYGHIIHTVAPFPSDPLWQAVLASCYRSSLAQAQQLGCQRVSVPLLGTGARGLPLEEACAVAAGAIHAHAAHASMHAPLDPHTGAGGTGPCDIDLVVVTEEAEQAALAALRNLFGQPV